MSKLAKNAIAAGLTTLLITAGVSFSANGATTTTSYAEAQFIAGRNALGVVVNALGNGLEDGGTSACEPATAECDGENFTSSPLQQLDALTIPVGNGVTGSALGPAGNYAKAGGGASEAASGAVTQDGIVHVGGGGAPATGNATFDLSGGALGQLGATDALANVSGDIGAVSSSIKLASPTAQPVRDYDIADATIVLSVPALGAINDAIDSSVDSANVPEEITVDSSTLCSALSNTLNVPVTSLGPLAAAVQALDVLDPADLIVDGQVDLCNNAVAAAVIDSNLFSVKLTGLKAITDGLTTTTYKGAVFDFSQGTVTLDLAAVLNVLGKDINNLPPSTDLLHEILPALALNVDDILANLNNELIEDFKNSYDLEVSIAGTPLPIGPLNDGIREQLLPNLQTGITELTNLFAQVGDPLSEALGTITTGLAQVAQLLVNVPDEYTALRKEADVSPLATSAIFSQTALELKVLGGQAADVLLANTLVGPNSSTTSADTDTNGTTNDPADDSDVSADGADDSDVRGEEVELTDSDSAADADVAGALAEAGAPNLLPFFLLGLALLAFGTAVMLNERRRTTDAL